MIIEHRFPPAIIQLLIKCVEIGFPLRVGAHVFGVTVIGFADGVASLALSGRNGSISVRTEHNVQVI